MSFSFKIARPPTNANGHKPRAPSRRTQPVNFSDSEDEVEQVEVVTEFDGRAPSSKKKDDELVITVAPDKDWRNSSLVKKRKVEVEMDVQVEKMQGGLQTVVKEKVEPVMELEVEEKKVEVKVEETEEQRAVRELLAAASSKPEEVVEQVGTIEVKENATQIKELEELDAFRADVQSRPDESTLDDYERVPVTAFGLALLRGMGLKKDAKLTPAYQPSARPAFLGIGAKPMADELGLDDVQKSQKAREDRRKGKEKFVPLTRRERERGEEEFSTSSAPISRDRSRSTSPRGNVYSQSSSRRESRRPSPSSTSRRREIEYDSDSRKSGRDNGDRRRDRDYESRKDRERDRSRDRNRERDRDYRKRDRDDYKSSSRR